MTNTAELRMFYKSSGAFDDYLTSNRERVREIRKLVRSHSKSFGRRILDLGCGGGVLGFELENATRRYVGVDANPDMIREARRAARVRGSRCRFKLGDITRLKVSGKFDTIALLGNGICHLSIEDLRSVIRALRKATKCGSVLVVEYADVIRLISRQNQERGKALKRLHTQGNPESLANVVDTWRGVLHRPLFPSKPSGSVKWKHAIWSPFILESLLAIEGWELVDRYPESEDRTLILDFFRLSRRRGEIPRDRSVYGSRVLAAPRFRPARNMD